MDDIQLCKEITRLKKELQKLVSIPGRNDTNDYLLCTSSIFNLVFLANGHGYFFFYFCVAFNYLIDKIKFHERDIFKKLIYRP